MNKCIYTRNDDSKATFNTREHIFPKCIGGIHCLPKGWVSDQVNNDLSKCELQFSRENPFVLISRMFSDDTGRKKHKNRNKVSVLKAHDGVSLGYVMRGKPMNLMQLLVSPIDIEGKTRKAQAKIIVPPTPSIAPQKQYETFLDELKTYSGSPCYIKSEMIPKDTCLLGVQDKKWFLGVSDKVNPKDIEAVLYNIISIMLEESEKHKGESLDTHASSSLVTVNVSMAVNMNDVFRVYAKIAINALAHLKGRDYVLKHDFDNIRNAILSGNEISKYVSLTQGASVVKDLFNKNNNPFIGDSAHTVVFLKQDSLLTACINLYGMSSGVMIELAETKEMYTDMYICDWQNNREYKMIDYVNELCKRADEGH